MSHHLNCAALVGEQYPCTCEACEDIDRETAEGEA